MFPCSFFQEHVPKIIQGSTTQPLEPPARTAVKKGFQYYEEILDRTIHYFQDRTEYGSYDPIFPGYEEVEKIRFPIFPGYEKVEKFHFPIFPGL